MKWIVLALLPLLVGCESLKRVSDGPSAQPNDPLILRGGQLGETPTFDVPTPANTKRLVLHDFMPADNVVRGVESATMRVFIKDDIANTWFGISSTEMPPFYYSYDAIAKTVTYHGRTLSTKKEYCIYVYLPA